LLEHLMEITWPTTATPPGRTCATPSASHEPLNRPGSPHPVTDGARFFYRAAEILESRRTAFLPELALAGYDPKSASRQVDLAIDRLVHYAGWTDKLSAVFGSVNPVASPHWNVTAPEPCGVTGVVCPDSPSLLALVTR